MIIINPLYLFFIEYMTFEKYTFCMLHYVLCATSLCLFLYPLYPFLKCKYQSQGAMIKIVIVWLWHLLICHRAERKNQRDKEKVSVTRFYFNWPILSISCTPRLLTKIFFSHDDNFSDGIRCWCQKLLLLFAHQRFNDKGKIKILLTLIRLNSHCPRALFFHTFIRNIK